jgi:hypothetical protein
MALRAELMTGTASSVMIGICSNCKGKIVSHSFGVSWAHMATFGPDGKPQHGENRCPPEGSRP